MARELCTFFGLELENARNGSKDLFPDDLHVWLTINEDGRLDEVSFVPDTVPSDVHCCTVRFAGFDVAHNALIPRQ